MSGLTKSDFEAEAFRGGVARAAVVTAGATNVNASRVFGITIRAARDVPAATDAVPRDSKLRPDSTTVVSYVVAFDTKADADAYAVVAARATDDALAAAANVRSNMRFARAETLVEPPAVKAQPTLPRD